MSYTPGTDFSIRTDSGYVEMYLTPEYTGVCTNDLSNSATVSVICKELGFTGGKGHLEIIDNVRVGVTVRSCYGTETSVGQCDIVFENECHNDHVHLFAVFKFASS